MPSSLLALLAGTGIGLSLIVAIGAQNAFVLRQGLRGEHLLPVVLVCAASDVVLIAAGVLGAGAAVARVPGLLSAVHWGGAVFLVAYGVLAARRAVRPGQDVLVPADDGPGPQPETDPVGGGGGSAVAVRPAARAVPVGAVVATAAALTWLNPHVYLDTVLLLGSVAQSYGEHRWAFALGACTASVVWFTALAFGARLLRPVFARPGAWRVLDAVIALVMVALGISLAVSA